MKKTIALVLALMLCLSLCACAGASGASGKHSSLVGEWTSKEGGFVLLSSGNVVNYASLAEAVNIESGIMSGNWEVEGDYLIIHRENYNAYRSAWVYKIVNDHTLERNGVTYTKTN